MTINSNNRNIMSDKKMGWTISQMEAIFDLELSTWVLPKYIPLNPLIITKRSIEEFKVNLIASCKLICRCKTALSRLIKCSNSMIENSEYNLRQIVHHVDNWVSSLNTFLKDILDVVNIKISTEIKKVINDTRDVVSKWNTKLMVRWNDKWEELSSEGSSEEESD